MNADPVQTLLILLVSSPLIVLVVWGGITTWRVEQRLASVLESTLGALEALGIEQVTSGTEDARVRTTSSEGLAPIPALSGAWLRWHETIVDVAGRPRTTRVAGSFLDPAAILAEHGQSRRGLLSSGFMETLPRQLVRLGLAGVLFVVTIDFWMADWRFLVDGPDRWASVQAFVAGLWIAPLPLFLGLVLAAWVRFFTEHWREANRAGLSRLTGWMDTHYRMVSQEELLARVLSALERQASKERS